MKTMKDFIQLAKEILDFLYKTKKWWLIPLFLFLIIVGLLIILASSSPVPIFIYPLV